MNEVEEYIRKAAAARGMDPDKVLRAINTEGGTKDPFLQSRVKKNGMQEPSYGPMQLLIGDGKNFPKGLGNRMIDETGIDPRKDWKAGIDYGLNTVAKEGWRQWYGPKNAGLPSNYGLTASTKGLQLTNSPVGAQALRDAAAAEQAQMPVDGMAPKLPPPIDVESAAVPSADSTLGNQLGTTLFGDELAGKLKALSAPASATSPAGPLGNLAGLAGAFTGNKNIEQANAEAANVGPSLMPSVDADIAGRMQGAQQLMATLLANRKKNPAMGMTLNNSGFM